MSIGRYGVYKRFANGCWWWVYADDDLTEAKAKMLEVARKTGQEHFVHDFLLGQCIATSIESKPDGSSATHAADEGAGAESSSQAA